MTLTYSTYKHQSDQDLLRRVASDILALKLRAQDGVVSAKVSNNAVADARTYLAQLLDELRQHVGTHDRLRPDFDLDVTLTGLAQRFVRVNPSDVSDRLAELERLRSRLIDFTQPLRDRDFTLLDGLQSLLEEETAEGVRSLYRF
jgi:hypothetical protein